MHQPDLNSLPATHIENWINPDQFTNQLMGPSRAKGRIVVGGIVKKIRQQGMRLLFQQVGVLLLEHLINTSTPNKHWSVSASCLMEQWREMWLAPSFLYFQPNKVKSGQYQTTNTYNRLIEPDNATSAATNMTSLLNMLSNKNIKEKLGKGTASSQGSFSVQDTFSFVVPYSSNHTNNGNTSGPIKTAYPVKNTEKANVAINSLINATPLNS